MKKQLLSIIIASTTLSMHSMDNNKYFIMTGAILVITYIFPGLNEAYKYTYPTLEDLKEEEKEANERARKNVEIGTIIPNDDRETYRKQCIEAGKVLKKNSY